MMDVFEITKAGQSLGYSGTELQKFVNENVLVAREREKDQIEREERAKAREAQKEEKEAKLELARIESEKEERSARYDLEKAQLESDERERAGRMELENNKMLIDKEERMARLQMEEKVQLAKVEKGMNDFPHNPAHASVPKMPKMPPFDDQHDNIDAYLRRFERIATTQSWPSTQWAAYLSTLLKGKSLEVYSRLTQNDAEDYDAVKTALLKRYEMTEEGFHQRFRSIKIETGESFSQCTVRLDNYFTRWIELSSTAKTYEALKDLLLREQLLNLVSRDLSIFLKERKPTNATDLAQLAEHFIDARSTGSGSGKFQKPYYPEKRDTKDRGNDSQKEAKGSPGKDANGAYMPLKQRRCYNCNEVGHISSSCPKPRSKSKTGAGSVLIEDSVNQVSGSADVTTYDELPDVDVRGTGELETGVKPTCEVGSEVSSGTMCGMCGTMPICPGQVEGKTVNVLRDTGCSGVIVRKSLVSDDCLTNETQTCVMADSRVSIVPVAWVTIDTPFYKGTVRAACMETPLCDLILGNIPGVKGPEELLSTEVDAVAAVETRHRKKIREEGMKPMKVMQSVGMSLSKDMFIDKQKQDDSLDKVRKLVEKAEVMQTDGGTSSYFMEGEMLYRRHVNGKARNYSPVIQAVVPTELRSEVMKVCHESLMGGHLGVKKTLDRVVSQFYWPGVHGDVRRHCMSCDICQRTIPKGKVGRIPLGTMPLIATPFERIAVDLVGPLYPVTDRGNRYILTVVDYATRYPEAVALPRIETEYVAEALLEIFCRVGVPKELLTDMGAQFTSAIMKEVSRLLSIKQLTTTPYHPMCNGLVERFNGTLKTMLKRLSAERPRDWDRYLPALLFAYREVPQESLGFAPFDLLYGRKVRGPVQILRELWTKDIESDEVRTTYEYVLNLQTRLEETMEVAHESLAKAAGKYKKYYNAKSKERNMRVGEKVLVLLPTNKNKLLLQWKGPFVIEEKFGIGNYRIRVGDKLKTYHANMLKKYVEREETAATAVMCDVSISLPQYVGAGLIDVPEIEEMEVRQELDMPGIASPPLEATESYLDVDISPELTEEQQGQVRELLAEYKDVLTDLPGKTDCIEYKIRLTSDVPIRSRPYPLPHHMRDVVAAEVQSMLKMGVIEPSESPYSSPIVLIKKPDNSYRFCSDFRKINQVTIFDSEPIALAESLFTKLSKCQYFTKIDISKAYWQIPMEEKSKELTAFITPDGLYQWRVMPFGVVNAPAVFTRLMRKVLQGISNVDSYIDDILEGTEDWDEHMVRLRSVLGRLRQYHLTAKPSKVVIGYRKLRFLGHTIGEGQMQPDPRKLDKIINLSRPTNKKQVRALIGLTSYYRKFIPNFSALAAPLTDLTKKGKSNTLVWTDSQEQAFLSLKQVLSNFPILRLPDLEKPFIVRTDASEVGIGAVLLQDQENEKFPVMYVSRKLLEREKNYSTIEKECLAIVWGVQKLNRYLYGRQFILETDHQPLIWMTKAKLANGRVMRWALALQPYRFLIRAVKGSENVGADLLSRCPP